MPVAETRVPVTPSSSPVSPGSPSRYSFSVVLRVRIKVAAPKPRWAPPCVPPLVHLPISLPSFQTPQQHSPVPTLNRGRPLLSEVFWPPGPFVWSAVPLPGIQFSFNFLFSLGSLRSTVTSSKIVSLTFLTKTELFSIISLVYFLHNTL